MAGRDGILFLQHPVYGRVGAGEAQIMVRCPNWDLKPTIVCTNRTASGPVRGFGGQELKCAIIPLLSLAMEKAAVDPLEFFKKNFVRPGDGYFWRDGIWYTYRGADYWRAMEQGRRAFWLEEEVERMAQTEFGERYKTERCRSRHGRATQTWARIHQRFMSF